MGTGATRYCDRYKHTWARDPTKKTSANCFPTDKQNALCNPFLSVMFESDPGNEQHVEAEDITQSPSRPEASQSGFCSLHVKLILGTERCFYSSSSSSTFSSLNVQM